VGNPSGDWGVEAASENEPLGMTTFVDTPVLSIDAADDKGAQRPSETAAAADVAAERAEELALARACAAGDARAMSRLYDRYSQRVFNVVCRMVGRQEAEELAQDAFVRVFKGIRGFRGNSALGTWIYRLTMNLCLSYLAKRTRRRRLQERYEREQVAIWEAPPKRSPWLRAQLERALGELPDGYRAVLVLHDVEGLSHKEIAAILDCREGTSKSQLHKARLRMRTLLEPALALEREAGEEPLEILAPGGRLPE
jgi:RNA polymerase sigma-70 factor (ECF subfamily)